METRWSEKSAEWMLTANFTTYVLLFSVVKAAGLIYNPSIPVRMAT